MLLATTTTTIGFALVQGVCTATFCQQNPCKHRRNTIQNSHIHQTIQTFRLFKKKNGGPGIAF